VRMDKRDTIGQEILRRAAAQGLGDFYDPIDVSDRKPKAI